MLRIWSFAFWDYLQIRIFCLNYVINFWTFLIKKIFFSYKLPENYSSHHCTQAANSKNCRQKEKTYKNQKRHCEKYFCYNAADFGDSCSFGKFVLTDMSVIPMKPTLKAELVTTYALHVSTAQLLLYDGKALLALLTVWRQLHLLSRCAGDSRFMVMFEAVVAEALSTLSTHKDSLVFVDGLC